MTVKSSGEISFRSSTGVDIEEEFGDTVGLDNSQPLFNQSTYLSGFYRGLTRLTSEGTQTKYGASQYRTTTYYGGPVTSESMHRYMVAFDPAATPTTLAGGYGRSSVFETEITSTQFGTGEGFTKQELDFYSPNLVVPFDARNMYIRKEAGFSFDEFGYSRYFTNGSLYSVETPTNLVRFNYWLGYAKKGMVQRLPSMLYFGDLAEEETLGIMDGIVRGDGSIPKSDVPFGLDRALINTSVDETIIGTPVNSQNAHAGFGGSYIDNTVSFGPLTAPLSALEICGNTLAAGATGDDTDATNSGAVYIYTRGSTGNTWTQEQVFSRYSVPITEFGKCVALSNTLSGFAGKTLAISGQGSDGKHNFITIYVRAGDDNGQWAFRRNITLPNDADGSFPDEGIRCLSLSDDGQTLAVGIPQSTGSTDPYGYNGVANQGRIEVYETTDNWNSIAARTDAHEYISENHGSGSYAGMSIAMAGDGNSLVVGIPKINYMTDTTADLTTPANLKGTIIHLHKSGGSWNTSISVSNPSGNDLANHRSGLGFSVDISYDGRMVVAGCARESKDNSLNNKGLVKVFEKTTATSASLTLTSEIEADDAAATDHFGIDVKLDMPAPSLANYPTGGTLIVGAKFKNTRQGAAYVFTNILPTPATAGATGHTWVQQRKIVGSQAQQGTSTNPVTNTTYIHQHQVDLTGSQFGLSVDIDGLYAVVLGNTNHFNTSGLPEPRGKLYLYNVDDWKTAGTSKAEYATNPFAGRYGTGTIPLTNASKPEIKFSHFYGATKKPAVWEAIADLYKKRHQTLVFTSGPSADGVYGVDSLLSDNLKINRAMFHHNAKDPNRLSNGSLPLTADAGRLDKGVLVPDTKISTTAAVRGSTDLTTDFHFGRGWGDMTLGEAEVVREAQRDYEYTTVLIHHSGAQIIDRNETTAVQNQIDFAARSGESIFDVSDYDVSSDANMQAAYNSDPADIQVLVNDTIIPANKFDLIGGVVTISSDYRMYDGDDAYSMPPVSIRRIGDLSTLAGWFSYGGGNTGGNSIDYQSPAVELVPINVNGTSAAGADAGYDNLRSAHSANSLAGTGNPSGFSGVTVSSRWYIAHILLPVTEIANIKFNFKTNYTDGDTPLNRHNAQDIHLIPGKWDYVAGSFEHGTGAISSSAAYEHGNNCKQNVNYGDLTVFCGFSSSTEFVNKMRPDLTYCTVPEGKSHDWSVHSMTDFSGYHQTKFNVTFDPTNPERSASAGVIAYEIQRDATSASGGFIGTALANAGITGNHGTDMQSFILRCSDT